MLCVLIRIASPKRIFLSLHNIHFQDKIKDLKLSQHYYYISTYGKSFQGLKNEFEIAVVNEPSVFEPLKFYSMY